jgi:hypothetical protein
MSNWRVPCFLWYTALTWLLRSSSAKLRIVSSPCVKQPDASSYGKDV